MDLTNLDISQYVWDEGYLWNEASDILFRATSSPRKEVSSLNANRNAPATSFDDFQESVNDAWDLGDDEFCVISGKNEKILNLTISSLCNLVSYFRCKNLKENGPINCCKCDQPSQNTEC